MERRICQAVRALRESGLPLVVANLHTTSSPGDPRIPAAELRRAAAWVDSFAEESDVVVLGGDFNVGPHSGAALPGYSDPGPGIDQLLVRGAAPSPLRVWPDERRPRDGILLSDHPPVELEIP
jgi:endonuclease/exonuclease/phosphatase family metal-dependent hydrolase